MFNDIIQLRTDSITHLESWIQIDLVTKTVEISLAYYALSVYGCENHRRREKDECCLCLRRKMDYPPDLCTVCDVVDRIMVIPTRKYSNKRWWSQHHRDFHTIWNNKEVCSCKQKELTREEMNALAINTPKSPIDVIATTLPQSKVTGRVPPYLNYENIHHVKANYHITTGKFEGFCLFSGIIDKKIVFSITSPHHSQYGFKFEIRLEPEDLLPALIEHHREFKSKDDDSNSLLSIMSKLFFLKKK